LASLGGIHCPFKYAIATPVLPLALTVSGSKPRNFDLTLAINAQ
jgi:hypothetical protein